MCIIRSAAFVLMLLCFASTRVDAGPRHSIGEYSYLIGTWTCSESFNGKATPFETSFAWMFPDRQVIEQRISSKSGFAAFILTYNRAKDDFRGVYVISGKRGAQAGSWINPGPQANGWTEHGYDLDASGFPRISESMFTRVTPSHYEVTDFDLSSGGRKKTDTEICNKQ